MRYNWLINYFYFLLFNNNIFLKKWNDEIKNKNFLSSNQKREKNITLDVF